MRRKIIQILLSLALIISAALLSPAPTLAAGSNSALLREVREYIKNNYVEPVDDSMLEGNSAEEIVDSLNDPYSRYLDPDAYSEFLHETQGEYEGVGMEVEQRDRYVTVSSLFHGGPAERAGLESGDRIIAVDGKNAVDEVVDVVVGWIKGDAGTHVVLTIDRQRTGKTFDVDLVRETIRTETISKMLLDDGLGYIRLTIFTTDAGDQVKQAVEWLKQEGAAGIILDLRDNPGGYLSSALDIADLFVPEGQTLINIRTRGRTVVVTADDPAVNMPLAVLVNGGSASAAEIVAAAVQDNGVGTLVGTTTFGKGTVQTLQTLTSVPNAALKLTIAEYYSPRGTTIDGVGIKPDVNVSNATRQLTEARDLLKPKVVATGMLEVQANGRVYLNGKLIAAADGTPFISHGRLMVPVRAVSAFLDGQLFWDEVRQEAILISKAALAIIPVNRDYMILKSGKIDLDVPARLVDGRVYVPLYWLSKLEGVKVQWDGTTGRAVIAGTPE